MNLCGRPAKILLIDTNVYFSKRLSDALKRDGFEVSCSTQPAFALTTLEYDAPTAIVCSTNMRELGALDIARMVRADAKNATLPIIALGDGSQRALMEAFQAGCDDYIDRTRPPAVLAAHIRNIIISKAEGFQPTQMLTQSDTSLSGSLTHHDLTGVMQMLGHAHQTGALHINSGDTDALLFFDGGAITHAECASLFGDEAVIHILKSCMRNNSGIYKFVYGSASPQRTVLRSATDLMLDAMRELDESSHAADVRAAADLSSVDAFSELAARQLGLAPAAPPVPPVNARADHSAIATRLDDFTISGAAGSANEAPVNCEPASSVKPKMQSDSREVVEPTHQVRNDELAPCLPDVSEPQRSFEPSSAADEAAQSPGSDQAQCTESPQALLQASPPQPGDPADAQNNSETEPFANYSIVPTFENEDIS
jgi:CheY-like chemotaxis protein